MNFNSSNCVFLVLFVLSLYFIPGLCQTNSTNSTCASFFICSDCTHQEKCVWCQSKNSCVPGWFYGPFDAFSCADWRWKTCSINVNILFWVAVGVVAIIVFGIPILILLYCFCCQSKRGKAKSLQEFSREREERESLMQESKTPRTDEAREKLRAKWGLGSSSRTVSSNTKNDPFDQTPTKL